MLINHLTYIIWKDVKVAHGWSRYSKGLHASSELLSLRKL